MLGYSAIDPLEARRSGPIPGARGSIAAVVALGVAVSGHFVPGAVAQSVAPIFGVTIPDGYRQWELVAVAHESDPLNELRAILGNLVAQRAYQAGVLPFPDGTILAKIAWTHVPSGESPPAFVPGAATTVQIMVKDSRRYASTGGWGFGRFMGGVAVDEAQHETCFTCHQALVKNHDFVFTRLAR